MQPPDSPEERRAEALRKNHPGSPPVELRGKEIESTMPKDAAPSSPEERRAEALLQKKGMTPKAAHQMPAPPPRPQKPPPAKEDDDADVAAIVFDDEDAAAGARRVKKALTVLADSKTPAKKRAAVAEALAAVLSGDSEASRGCLRLRGSQAERKL